MFFGHALGVAAQVHGVVTDAFQIGRDFETGADFGRVLLVGFKGDGPGNITGQLFVQIVDVFLALFQIRLPQAKRHPL